MKIAYDAQIFIEQRYGGISRYFCEIASKISEMSESQVLITAPMHINAYIGCLPASIVSGFNLPSASSSLSIKVRLLCMLWGDLMLRAFSPDIIHETYFFPYRLGPRNAKRVLTIHDMIHEKFPSYFDPKDRTSKYKSLAAKRADHIICISESTRRDVIDLLGVSPDKITVIHHGFDLLNEQVISASVEVLLVCRLFLISLFCFM